VVVRLYNDLPHPPATYIGDRYDFREADGSLNNVDFPDIGKAGHAYSRNVQSKIAMPQAELPDPDLIFEALLEREGFVPHPAGNSSLMFGCAIDFITIPFSPLSDPPVSASLQWSSTPSSGPTQPLAGR
jgi:linoleate 10R-lipoxygenase